MKIEAEARQGSVREGYQLLLRAYAELLLPMEQKKIRAFYEHLCHACMTWAIEVHGEVLRKEFLELESVKEKSRFRTQSYRFRMRMPWQEGKYAVLLCESVLMGEWSGLTNSYYRISHVWNVEEELMLPLPQILRVFGIRITKDMFPFRPDGIYPEGSGLVLFRNATQSHPFTEKRLSGIAAVKEVSEQEKREKS